MKPGVLHVVSAGAVLAGAIAAVTAAPVTPVSNPLRVSLTAVNNVATIGSARRGFSGQVDVTVTNASGRTVRVPRWELPAHTPGASLFAISVDGEQIRYEGRMIKRGLPTAADFVVLRPGQSFTSRVDLASAYDLSRTGQYTVSYVAPLQFASTSDGTMLNDASGVPWAAQSAPLQVWVNGNARLGADSIQSLRKAPEVGAAAVVGGVNYVGCSSTRINTLGSAISAARGYSENAKGYLNEGRTGSRYGTWFGAYTTSRYSTARSHFTSIDSAMDRSDGSITINCGCTDSYYAYVYPNRPYEIFVCNAFWSAPTTGTDSKAGTLIHEMSHFTVVAGTDDHAYGQSAAKRLATKKPTRALDNADNHEYFAENTPALN